MYLEMNIFFLFFILNANLSLKLSPFADNEMLRRQFAEKANNVGPWIEKQMDAVTAIGMGIQGSLEDQLLRLREYEQAVFAYKPNIEELEKIHQAVQESMIFENRYFCSHFQLQFGLTAKLSTDILNSPWTR
jgi:hypothetical protein